MNRTLVVALLLAPGCSLGVMVTKPLSWPLHEGLIEVDGAAAMVKVRRDELGVPHIRADSEHDAWFGLGFAHAQDRLFQADLNRHIVTGRMTEWFGDDLAPTDAWFRGLEIQRRAHEMYERSSDDTKAAIDAYTAGFNEAIAAAAKPPVEHRLLEVEVEPFTVDDTASIAFLMGWDLQENAKAELLALALRDVPAEKLDALLRTDPGDPPVDAYWDELRGNLKIGDFTAPFAAFSDGFGGRPSASQASNAWVVGPSRSASGKPILANDPHLHQRVPSIWYAADIQGGSMHVAGATMPGAPGVILGHNDKIAWGWTNVMADVVDLAVLDKKDDGYVLAGETKAFRRIPVDIALAPDKKDPTPRRYTAEILWTDVGPVITDASAEQVVALRWTALEIEDRTFDLVLGLDHAQSVEEALAAVDRPSFIAQNLVVADVDGHIGWKAFGSFPSRVDHTGRVPYYASAAETGWHGWQPNPFVVDPESGVIVTANSRPDVPHADEISSAFVPPHRYGRINELLAAKDKLTADDMGEIQRDWLDPTAREWLPEVLKRTTIAADDPNHVCVDLLSGWDYVDSPDAVAPTVWAATWEALQGRAARALVNDDHEAALWLDATSPSRALLPDVAMKALDDAGAWNEVVGGACTDLITRYGDKPEKWTWGSVHKLSIKHPFSLGGKVKGFSMPSTAWGGSGSTVNAAGWSYDDDDWTVGDVVSLRQVYDLADPGASTLVYPGGQSGHPSHPQYRSHWEAFVTGQTLPLFYDDDDLRGHIQDSLVLRPKQ